MKMKAMVVAGLFSLTAAQLSHADFASDFAAATSTADKLAVLSSAVAADPSMRVSYQRFALVNSTIHPREIMVTMATALAGTGPGRFGGPNGTPGGASDS